jgi:hypothetical protein
MGNLACYHFFNCSVFMANHQFGNEFEYQQHKGGGLPVHTVGVDMQLSILKRIIQMAQIKWLSWLGNILGIGTAILGFLSNIDNVKSAILFLVGLTFLMFRTYYSVIKWRQEVREKEIALWHQEMDKQERIDKIKK